MKLTNQAKVILVLAVVLLAQSVFVGVGFSRLHKLEQKPAADSREQQNLQTVALTALNALSLNQPAVSVSDSKIYFPDIHLALPLNDDSLALLYSGRSTGNPDKQTMMTYDVTTRSLASLSPLGFQDQFACYPIRLAFEDKANPFNPHENNNTAVKLADGRTLQIYAYANDKCEDQWKAANTSPEAMKKVIEQAESY